MLYIPPDKINTGVISINRASYFSGKCIDLSGDLLGRFLNSITFTPHGFGHQHSSGDFSTQGYRLIGDYEILFYISGEGTVTVGEKTYTCRQGNFVFIPPFLKHSISTTWENPHDVYWIHFDITPLSLNRKFISLFTSQKEYLISVNNFDKLLSVYKSLEEEYNKGEHGLAAFFKSAIIQILVYVLKNIDTNQNFTVEDMVPANIQHVADRVIEYINSNISEIESVQSLCSKFKVSRTYLNNIFEETVGLPPGKMIQYLKLKNAESLLLTTSMSINEISDTLGYSSPSYFSNTFKKIYGCPPGKYRNDL